MMMLMLNMMLMLFDDVDAERDAGDVVAGDGGVDAESVQGHVDAKHDVADDVGVDDDLDVEHDVDVVDDVDVARHVDDVPTNFTSPANPANPAEPRPRTPRPPREPRGFREAC